MREKLLDPANFSDPDGTVPRDVVITDTAGPITAELLADLDVFFIGYFADSHPNAFTSDELDASSRHPVTEMATRTQTMIDRSTCRL